jgi:pimeloyl-ACP methyl ester carboxylesterase
MNGRIQRWLLLARVLFALSMAGCLWRAGVPHPATLVATALAFWFPGWLMLALFISLLWINRGACSVRQLLRAYAHEFWIYERVFAWQQPFAEHQEPDFLPKHARGPGVLLLHGFSCNRGLWNGWMRPLRERGHPHIALSLEPAFGSIDAYADSIETAVQRLTECCGQAPLIVAHSMGGLAARAWRRRFGSSGRVRTIVTLGTPHAGTLWASYSLALNTRQMRRGGPWLAELAAAEAAQRAGAGFDCYYSDCDQIVCPAETAVLAGARAISVAGTGHLALVFERRVFADVLRLLA